MLVAVDQPCQKLVAHIFWYKGRVQRIPIALKKVLGLPTKGLVQLGVLLVQRDVSQGTCIGVHPHRHARPVQFVDGMIGVGIIDIDQDIAGWAHLEMDLVLP